MAEHPADSDYLLAASLPALLINLTGHMYPPIGQQAAEQRYSERQTDFESIWMGFTLLGVPHILDTKPLDAKPHDAKLNSDELFLFCGLV